MLRSAGSAVIACVLLLSVGACRRVAVNEGPAPGVRVRDPKAPYAAVRMNSVAIIDDSLQQWHGKPDQKSGKVAVERTGARRTATGTLEGWAILRNRTDHPLQVEGRTQFFDHQQAPLEGPGAWQRVFLPPNGVATYKGLSTGTDQVAYYYIEIREGR